MRLSKNKSWRQLCFQRLTFTMQQWLSNVHHHQSLSQSHNWRGQPTEKEILCKDWKELGACTQVWPRLRLPVAAFPYFNPKCSLFKQWDVFWCVEHIYLKLKPWKFGFWGIRNNISGAQIKKLENRPSINVAILRLYETLGWVWVTQTYFFFIIFDGSTSCPKLA